MKDLIIDRILNDPNMDKWNKEGLVKAVLASPESHAPVINLEVEKYRIDKMIESGLIKEQNFKGERWFQLVLSTLAEKKLLWFYALMLSFIFLMFNSGNFWKYTIKELDYQYRSK